MKTSPKAAPKTAGAQTQSKDALGTLRIDFYYDQYYLLAFVTFCLVAITGGMGFWGFYETTLQEVPDQAILAPNSFEVGKVTVNANDPILIFPTTADGKLFYPTPLSDPFLSTPALLEWAVESVISAYTFNFVNYEQIITNSSVFFTKSGYQDYRRTLIESNIANSVDRNKYVLSIVPTNAPNILKEKPTPDGNYSWQIQFPIMMTFQNVRETQKSEWIITMAIERVPLTDSPNGVAIAALIIRQGKAVL
ncbi:MAG: DotI/IcmL/TraM family protein [Proteobacteria bacterium]|nr:DotI/IcmL/TraM family protein [Pseudomonadota bacterium]